MHEQEYNAQWKQCCLPAIGSRSAVCFFSASFRFRPNRQWTMMGGWKVFVCLFLWRGWGGGVRVAVFLFVFLLFVFFFRQTQRAREIDQRRNNRCVRAVSFDPRSLSFRLLLSFVRMFTECSNRDGRSRFRIVWLLPACFP